MAMQEVRAHRAVGYWRAGSRARLSPDRGRTSARHASRAPCRRRRNDGTATRTTRASGTRDALAMQRGCIAPEARPTTDVPRASLGPPPRAREPLIGAGGACRPHAPPQGRCSRASFHRHGRARAPGCPSSSPRGRTAPRAAGGGTAGTSTRPGAPVMSVGSFGFAACFDPGPWQTSHCTSCRPVDVRHGAAAGPVVAGHVAAHALEVELLELRGERRVGLRVARRVPHLARARGGSSSRRRCRRSSPGRAAAGAGTRSANATRLWSLTAL